MIRLEKLTEADFTIFKSWIKNKNDLFQFAGPIFKFPVTDEQLLSYINDIRREVYKVILIESNEIIGNAEVNLENALPRLSRILIGNPEQRNKGIGKYIVIKMLEKIFNEKGFQNADLNVFDWNIQAIKCYEKIGFDINANVSNKQVIEGGETWTAINMTISKMTWSKGMVK